MRTGLKHRGITSWWICCCQSIGGNFLSSVTVLDYFFFPLLLPVVLSTYLRGPDSVLFLFPTWIGAERLGSLPRCVGLPFRMNSKRGSYFPRPFDRRKYSGMEQRSIFKKYLFINLRFFKKLLLIFLSCFMILISYLTAQVKVGFCY